MKEFYCQPHFTLITNYGDVLQVRIFDLLINLLNFYHWFNFFYWSILFYRLQVLSVKHVVPPKGKLLPKDKDADLRSQVIQWVSISIQ